jgi:hypothetical protein
MKPATKRLTLADPHQPLSAGDDVELHLLHPLCFDAAGRRILSTGLNDGSADRSGERQLMAQVGAVAEELSADNKSAM